MIKHGDLRCIDAQISAPNVPAEKSLREEEKKRAGERDAHNLE